MQINIGNKIKELRKRDGRKQEDLAKAVGVTVQAVSRWESGGSYPDMETVPSIAHYFHVSIDELFCYSGDREDAIENILEEAGKSIAAGGDQTQCIERLRAAAEEFPSSPDIFAMLGFVLEVQGNISIDEVNVKSKDDSKPHHKINMTSNSDSENSSKINITINDDSGYNQIVFDNPYYHEAIRALEKALDMNIQEDVLREKVLTELIYIYALTGKSEKAKELANKQNTIYLSRELLLASAAEAEEKDTYCGQALIDILRNLYIVIINSLQNKKTLAKSDTAVDIPLSLAHFYESIFSDGQFGIIHINMFELYNRAAISEAAHHPDSPKAIEYFARAFEHKKTYDEIRCAGEYHYGAPLVSKVVQYVDFPDCFGESYWQKVWTAYPESLKNAIAQNPEFAEVFEKKRKCGSLREGAVNL